MCDNQLDVRFLLAFESWAQVNTLRKNESLPDSSINPNVDIEETRLRIETTPENNFQSTITGEQSLHSRNGATYESKMPDTSSCIDLTNVSSPFKESLFWPKAAGCSRPKRFKEKIPSFAISDSWKKYHHKKEEKKEKDELEKENRKRVREKKKKEAKRLKTEKKLDRRMKRKYEKLHNAELNPLDIHLSNTGTNVHICTNVPKEATGLMPVAANQVYLATTQATIYYHPNLTQNIKFSQRDVQMDLWDTQGSFLPTATYPDIMVYSLLASETEAVSRQDIVQ
ncbi:hypothetical protein ILUMI_09932 [Ignelater luminosus]|uniref:Uncharacterized protein n=1 Tax=Ignelater luminosus TaxID=2038154 RepID=A0A8K0D4V5_IGNLU|nr:hypothetical protein ILUMI_09932 [Ignelater luminosus]